MGDQAAFISAGGYHHHIGLNTWESDGWRCRRHPARPGLYHVAVRFPDRKTLAEAVHRVLRANIQLDGASDHGVSEAVYLRDPDGNGVELYRDRPRDEWPRAVGRRERRDVLAPARPATHCSPRASSQRARFSTYVFRPSSSSLVEFLSVRPRNGVARRMTEGLREERPVEAGERAPIARVEEKVEVEVRRLPAAAYPQPSAAYPERSPRRRSRSRAHASGSSRCNARAHFERALGDPAKLDERGAPGRVRARIGHDRPHVLGRPVDVDALGDLHGARGSASSAIPEP